MIVKSLRRPVLVASLVAGVVAATLVATPAAARPHDGCAGGTQSLHGEIRGSDGLFVDATLAFDLTDSAGHALNADGCRASSATPAFFVNPNYTIAADGETFGGTFLWQVDLPANATKVEIETYPRNPAAAPKYQVTNTKYYARSMRHFDLPTSASIQIVMPRADSCPSSDGIASRTVQAFVVGWSTSTHRATLTHDAVTYANAFSALADANTPGFGNPVMGLGIGRSNSDGTVSLAQLASAARAGQPYTFVFRAAHAGGRAYSTDYRGRQTFGVTACTSGFATIYEIPGGLSASERHKLADYLYSHFKSYLVNVNV